ncbi:Importin-7 [Dactylella cylindrospora]|nr:Importin-7 [Dactylella cylindrospora]
MDSAALRGCILSTFVNTPGIRLNAEQQLKQAEQAPGFIGALLDIVDTDPDLNIRLSAVLYVKNKVLRSWETIPDSKAYPIPEDEKPTFRERLIPTLTRANNKIRQQMLPMMGKILHYDFPEKWPSYMPSTVELLQQNDANAVFSGLQCLLAICRVYRLKSAADKREELEGVIQVTFPLILRIGGSLVERDDNESGEMLRLIFKTYKHAIYYELLATLRQHDNIVGWATLFIKVVSKTPPPDSLPEDIDEREMHPWWKAKKWAYSNLNRLFVRYGNPQSLNKSATAEYEQFANGFIESFVPEIVKAYLGQIDLWAQKKTWLSRNCLSFTLSFLEECIKPKNTWQLLKPHVDILVSHVLFPLLCQTADDLEMFDIEPVEYIHRKLNFYEDISAPDVAATNFLVTLTKSRKSTVFNVLNYVNEIVNKYEQSADGDKNPQEKEGALRMIGSLSSILLGKKSPIADKIEYFFVRHVFPEFQSQHPFLRARACDVVDKFSDLDFQDQNNIVLIYQSIITCLNDQKLPVRVEAALALSPLIRHEYVRAQMQGTIVQIMQQLLTLTNEVDLDSLANVMEELVESFATQLTPFAVDLTKSLRDTYLRIVSEVLDKNAADDDSYNELIDDKSITALGILQTIGTLILTLETSPDILLHLETILEPVIKITLENKLYDLYNEVFEIIDSCTFSAKAISPTMWMVFGLIHSTFKDKAEFYVEEMLPALDNYVSYGAEVMKQNPAYLEAIFDIIQTIFVHEKLGAMDRICGCKLAEAVLLNLRGNADQYLQRLIELPMLCLTAENDIKVKAYRVHLMEMVINCIYYNPATTLQILETHGWTSKFFTLWFSNIEHFNRVHDKKLSIVAIIALLGLTPEQIPASIQPYWSRLLQGLVKLFQTLPVAMKAREEAQKEELYDEGYPSDSDNEWDGETGEWEENETGEDKDVHDEESAAYMEFLSQEAQRFNSQSYGVEDDEELEEESLLETPLDNIEPYQVFRDAFISILSADEKNVLQGVVKQADDIQAAMETAGKAA